MEPLLRQKVLMSHFAVERLIGGHKHKNELGVIAHKRNLTELRCQEIKYTTPEGLVACVAF